MEKSVRRKSNSGRKENQLFPWKTFSIFYLSLKPTTASKTTRKSSTLTLKCRPGQQSCVRCWGTRVNWWKRGHWHNVKEKKWLLITRWLHKLPRRNQLPREHMGLVEFFLRLIISKYRPSGPTKGIYRRLQAIKDVHSKLLKRYNMDAVVEGAKPEAPATLPLTVPVTVPATVPSLHTPLRLSLYPSLYLPLYHHCIRHCNCRCTRHCSHHCTITVPVWPAEASVLLPQQQIHGCPWNNSSIHSECEPKFSVVCS